MLKPILNCFFIALMVVSPVLADDTLSVFNQQGS